ncbi:MAG: RNA polymerase sigma factor [Desulfarculaceae bacterium]
MDHPRVQSSATRPGDKKGNRNGRVVGALARMARDGDQGAFEQLVDMFWGDIYRMAYFRTFSAPDAEDLSQEVFLKAFRHVSRLKDPGSFKSWLFSIAINTVKNFYRKNKLLKIFVSSGHQDEDYAAEPEAQPVDSALDSAMRRQFWGQVKDFKNALPRMEREVFTLRFMDQLRIHEIAEALDKSPSAVKTHLYRAVAKLRKTPVLTEMIESYP